MDKETLRHLRGIKAGQVRDLGQADQRQVYDSDGQPRVNTVRPGEKKINFNISDILHIKTDQIPDVIKSYWNWADQWEPK